MMVGVSRWRLAWVILGLFVVLAGLVYRMLDLAVFDRSFLLKQGNARTLRLIEMPAHRGIITDRNAVPLAISTPVDSVWVNAIKFNPDSEQLKALAKLLDMKVSVLEKHLRKNKQHSFVYLKRHVPPSIAEKIKQMDLGYLSFEHGYKRYYPQGAVTAHVIGLTNVDDIGQEGVELAYNGWLQGVSGKQWVTKDRLGNIVDTLKTVSLPQEGHNLTLSLDHRIQYLAYRELQAGVQKSHAEAGSVVVLDAKTGEVLAMVNQPSYNPNQRPEDSGGRYRNRAVTDTFEPGSTMKAFSLASAIASGHYHPDTMVDTNPGRIKIGDNMIIDEHLNHGKISVSDVLKKSSNVGTAKITLSLPAEHLWHVLKRLGFGELTESGFPGEVPGSLVYRRNWKPFELATLSFGYGITVNTLQLARAYAIIADAGFKKPVFLVRHDESVQGEQVFDTQTAQEVLSMLETVVQTGGTGRLARVSGYRVAGKTGTAYIAGTHGYNKHRYIASFVGIAPVSHPRFVVAVVVRCPDDHHHYGGIVAAPIFSRIMAGTLRLYHVPFDKSVANSIRR